MNGWIERIGALSRLLFVPAIAVMNRLSYARKFIFIGLLLSGPLATVLFLFYSSSTERIEFSRRERIGLAYLEPTRDFVHALQRHRVLYAAAMSGDGSAENWLAQTAQQMDRAAVQVDQLDERYGELLHTTELWTDSRQRWNRLRDATAQRSLGLENEYAVLSAQLLDLLLNRAGNASNLILDPELDSYWLVETLVVKLPVLGTTVGQAGAASLTRPTAPTARFERLANMAAGMRLSRSMASELAQVNMHAVFRQATSSGQHGVLEAVLNQPLREAVAAVQSNADFLANEVFPAAVGVSTIDHSANLLQGSLTALQRLHQLSTKVSPELDKLIERRLKKYQRQRTIGLNAAGGAALMLAYLFCGFYLSVRRSMLALRVSPLAPDGAPVDFEATSRDELGQIAAAYSKTHGEKLVLQEQLRRADQLATVGRLAAGAAHELNEPLGAILGFAQLAQKSPQVPQMVARDLGKITKAALHAREIIKQLLLFARQTPPQKVLLDINQVIEESLEFLEPRCEKEEISLVRNLANSLPQIEADPNQLRQVVLNLSVNAIQATSHRGQVHLQTSLHDHQILFVVQDQGRGMSEEVRKHLFLPFYTTKEIGQGVGLGLSVVHGIVTAHGGTVQVVSAPDQGTRIEVRLPLPEIVTTASPSEPVAAGPTGIH